MKVCVVNDFQFSVRIPGASILERPIQHGCYLGGMVCLTRDGDLLFRRVNHMSFMTAWGPGIIAYSSVYGSASRVVRPRMLRWDVRPKPRTLN